MKKQIPTESAVFHHQPGRIPRASDRTEEASRIPGAVPNPNRLRWHLSLDAWIGLWLLVMAILAMVLIVRHIHRIEHPSPSHSAACIGRHYASPPDEVLCTVWRAEQPRTKG